MGHLINTREKPSLRVIRLAGELMAGLIGGLLSGIIGAIIGAIIGG